MSQSMEEAVQYYSSLLQNGAGASPPPTGSLRSTDIPRGPRERDIYEGAGSLVGQDWFSRLPDYNSLYPSKQATPLEQGIETQFDVDKDKILRSQVYPSILQLSQQPGPPDDLITLLRWIEQLSGISRG